MVVEEKEYRAYDIKIEKWATVYAQQGPEHHVSYRATITHRNSDEVLSVLSTDDKDRPITKLLFACEGLIESRRMLKNAKK